MKHVILFVREGRGVEAAAILILESDHKSVGQLLRDFETAVDDWVSHEAEGMNLHKYSCGDTNIGDLMGHLESPECTIHKYLAKMGITNVDASSFSEATIQPYDKVLCHVTLEPEETDDQSKDSGGQPQ